MKYTSVHIIYNPKSTGKAGLKAKRLAARTGKFMDQKIELVPTMRAKHAIELAAAISRDSPRPLIISVSGDGGYHEVLNGVMQAIRDGDAVSPTIAVEAAGNANDHYHYVRTESLVKALRQDAKKPMRCIEVIHKGTSLFAHSYWGLGHTAKSIDALNKTKLNPILEKVLLAKELVGHHAIKVRYGSNDHRVNNIVAAKIPRMAKVIKINKDLVAPPADKFWLLIDKEQTRTGVVKSAIKGALGRLEDQSELRQRFAVTVKEDWVMQLDGEVYPLKAGDKVQIKIAAEQLETI